MRRKKGHGKTQSARCVQIHVVYGPATHLHEFLTVRTAILLELSRHLDDGAEEACTQLF